MISSRRSAEPAPLTYLLAAFVGAVLGLVGDFAFGLPWLPVAAGFVALVWLAVLSTALFGPLRIRKADLHKAIDPMGSRARTHARLADEVQDGELIAFAAVDAPRVGWLQGHGWGSDGLDVTLRHGGVDDDGPSVTVQTSTGRARPASTDVLKEELFFGELLRERGRPPSSDPVALERWARATEELLASTEMPPWAPGRIRVDGEDHTSRELRLGTTRLVVASIGLNAVGVSAVGLAKPDLELRRVSDLTPYIEAADRIIGEAIGGSAD